MKKVMLMYSGGVESTAAACYAIEQGFHLSLVHVIHNTNSKKELSACQMIAWKHISKHIKVYPVWFNKNTYDNTFMNAHNDKAIWLGAAIAIAPRGDFDEVWHGMCNEDKTKGGNQLMLDMEKGWDEIAKITGIKTKLKPSPLHHMTKLEQYMSLTPKCRDSIIYCAQFPKGPMNSSCGKCGKCREFKKYVTDRMEHWNVEGKE